MRVRASFYRVTYKGGNGPAVLGANMAFEMFQLLIILSHSHDFRTVHLTVAGPRSHSN